LIQNKFLLTIQSHIKSFAFTPQTAINSPPPQVYATITIKK